MGSEFWSSDFDYKVKEFENELSGGLARPAHAVGEDEFLKCGAYPTFHEMQTVQFHLGELPILERNVMENVIGITEGNMNKQSEMFAGTDQDEKTRFRAPNIPLEAATCGNIDNEKNYKNTSMSAQVKPGKDDSIGYKKPRKKVQKSNEASATGGCICRDCGMRYSCRSGLRYHRISRHEGRNYTCDVCDMKVSRPWALKRHMERQHVKS